MAIAHAGAMAKTSPDLDTSLHHRLMALAAFEPHGIPVVSLYLNLTPDQHGRDNYNIFARKAFADQLKRLDEKSAEHASLERDVERINDYLSIELNRAANGLAIFASSGTGEFFEAIQLQAPIGDHWLFIGEAPHIYPLVRLIDQYPRYAAVLLDTNSARIVVFSLGAVEKSMQLAGVKTRRHSMGGSSQARYQRHLENFHLHHVKEVVDTLDRVVRADNIQKIIVAGDEVVVPIFKDAIPAHLSEKLVDVMKLDRQASNDEIAEATLEALRQQDARTDSERVQSVVDAWRAGGPGCHGPRGNLTSVAARTSRGVVDRGDAAGPEAGADTPGGRRTRADGNADNNASQLRSASAAPVGRARDARAKDWRTHSDHRGPGAVTRSRRRRRVVALPRLSVSEES
jgi:peptide subunit release factor 1 (eRF1)